MAIPIVDAKQSLILREYQLIGLRRSGDRFELTFRPVREETPIDAIRFNQSARDFTVLTEDKKLAHFFELGETYRISFDLEKGTALIQ